MSNDKLLQALCVYDPRSPHFADLNDPEEPRPPRLDCRCDNCFYGRDALAVEALRLTEALAEHEAAKVEPALCRTDGRCQYAIDSGAEGMGHCPKGKCVMPVEPAPELTDEELLQAIRQCGAGCVADWGLTFARAVIAAHEQKRGVK